MLSIFCVQAHTPEFSMYKSVEKKSLKEKAASVTSKKTGKLLAGAGGCIILGGILQGIAAVKSAPDFDVNNQDFEGWNNRYNQWKKDQRTFKLSGAAMYTIGGICLLFVGDDILTSLMENKATTLKLKTSASSVGLCLNFK